MRCHYCDVEADLAVERESIKVGLCERHFRERLEELADDDRFEELRDELER